MPPIITDIPEHVLDRNCVEFGLELTLLNGREAKATLLARKTKKRFQSS